MNDNVKGFLGLVVMGLEAYVCGRLLKKFIGDSNVEVKECLSFLKSCTRRADVIEAILNSEDIHTRAGKTRLYELIEEGRRPEYYNMCLSIVKDTSTTYLTKESKLEDLNRYFY